MISFINSQYDMYIKNQQFNDEDTLFEVLFDFEIGDASPYMDAMVANIEQAMDGDAAFNDHLKTLDEEDSLELYDDVRREQVVKHLQENFTAFVVEAASFYAVAGKERTLLYTIDMY